MVSWGAQRLPEASLDPLSRLLARLWFDGLRYRRTVLLTQLAYAHPEHSSADLRRTGQAVCRHLVRTLLEFLRIPRYRQEGFSRVRIEGWAHHISARQQGRGVLILSGHLGSWELAVAAVAQDASPLHLVVKSFSPGTERFISKLRTDGGLRLIAAKGGMTAILRALRRNETVVFVLDQNAIRSLGVFVDFFGRPACTMMGLAQIALRTKAPVLPAIPYRATDGTHVLDIGPPVPRVDAEDRKQAVVAMTQAYTARLEAAILAHPEQWLWTHKRWRTTPP